MVPPILRALLWSALSKLVPSRGPLGTTVREKARRLGDQAVEKAQDIYFRNPGLDTLTVRSLSKTGQTLARFSRLFARLQVALHLDRGGLARDKLALPPRPGYDSLMMASLAAGLAFGYFRSGSLSSVLWWDSADPDPKTPRRLPEGHSYPGVRRFSPPRSLREMSADIDDLYWADAFGQAIKVTRVGTGDKRRWLVSLPGTDHADLESLPNPADIESNVKEELDLNSAMREGTVQAVRSAMAADGVPEQDMVREPVLICGHSQGGMIAAGLAELSPKEAGINVTGAVTLGSPTRRVRIREDVTMIAVEHDQDMIPSLDGAPRLEADARVVVKRRLTQPKRGPLFYAHSSATYTETLRLAERRQAIAPWGRAAEAFKTLRSFLPLDGEETRVTHHYVWQEVREPKPGSLWKEYLNLRFPGRWQPVIFPGEPVVPAVSRRKTASPKEAEPSLSEVQDA